jgi:serine/threonine-protein phosphatase PGAM5
MKSLFLILVGISVVATTVLPCLAEPGSRTLYLVRHGYYHWEEGVDSQVGNPLVPLGVAQARLVSARLRGMPVEMSMLHSSTMTRARQTADVIHQDFPELEWVKHKKLSECTPTTRRKDVMEDTEPEEVAECEEQLEAAFSEFFVPSPDGDRHEMIICHANVIRWFVTRALGVDPHAWLGMSLSNCSITVIRINADGTMKILKVGDAGHIPPNLQSGSDRVDRTLAIPEG